MFKKNYLFTYIIIGLFLGLLIPHTSNAQGLSTEGDDFWFGFMDNWLQFTGNPIILEVYVSAEDTTSGTLSIPRDVFFTPIPFTVYPGATTRLIVPTSYMASGSNRIEDKGIHLVTDNTVSVYAMNKRQYSADVSVILPTYSLGNEYYVMSHWETGNRNGGNNSDAEFMIVAIADSTTIEITPTVLTEGDDAAGVPFTIMLHEGETYQVQARADLTGTRIRGIGDQDKCQNFAVYAGNQYTKIGLCDITDGHDHLFAQQYPTTTWGTEYITVPLETRIGGDLIKILAAEDNTSMSVNGSSYQLDEGEFVTLLLSGVNNIIADKPISVGQFSRSMGCDDTIGDPFFLQISPNQQLLERITFFAPTIATLNNYSLNIIAKTDEISEIYLDGNEIIQEFQPVPNNNEFSFAQVRIFSGNHTLESQGGFIAYIYGFGFNESFGYATGASLDNLNLEIEISNDIGITLPSDSLCLHDIIVFEAVTNLDYTTYEWSFGDGETLVTVDNQIVNHQYENPGTYLFELNAYNESGLCTGSNQETVVKIIHVVNPMPEILGPRSICPNTQDVSYWVEDGDVYSYQWIVDGGLLDQQYGDSIIVDWGPTNADASIKLVATNALGCQGDTVIFPVRINIKLEPEAPIGPDTLCIVDAMGVMYNTFFTQGSSYQWMAENGTIVSGQGSHEVIVDWLTPGTGKLWFEQTTVTDTICDGISDTLSVFIQRLPSQQAFVKANKVVLQVNEPVFLDVIADTLLTSVNWNLGDGTILDSLTIGEITHVFDCPGIYEVTIQVYDSMAICDVTAMGSINLEVLPVEIEMIQVGTLEANDSLMHIVWDFKNGDFINTSLNLARESFLSGNLRNLGVVDGNAFQYIDSTADTRSFYEYFLLDNDVCPEINFSDRHRNIVLSANIIDEQSGVLNWSVYDDWQNGVDRYEIYRSVDGSPFEMMEDTGDLTYLGLNDTLGFDYCYRIKAIESGGNNAYSWSNIACISFAPPIITFNIITPNSDQFNEEFVFKGLEFYPNNHLTIFNRWGRKIIDFESYNNNWDGKINGVFVASGVYYYVLELNDPRSTRPVINGQISVLR